MDLEVKRLPDGGLEGCYSPFSVQFLVERLNERYPGFVEGQDLMTTGYGPRVWQPNERHPWIVKGWVRMTAEYGPEVGLLAEYLSL